MSELIFILFVVLIVVVLVASRARKPAKIPHIETSLRIIRADDLPPPTHCWRDGRCGYCALLEKLDKEEAAREKASKNQPDNHN